MFHFFCFRCAGSFECNKISTFEVMVELNSNAYLMRSSNGTACIGIGEDCFYIRRFEGGPVSALRR